MDVQPTNLQKLRDAIMSIWTKISEECFQHLVKSMPQRIIAVLKTKGVQPGTSKMYLIKWPVSVYIYIYNQCVTITATSTLFPILTACCYWI